MPEQEFSGSVALVTGGSRGIGRAVCLRLAQSGARVAINYAANEAAAQETKAMIEAKGGSAEVFQARAEEPKAVSAMVQAVEQQFGPVDLLVTSAGILAAEPNTEMTFEGWQRVLRTNVDGTYLPVMAVKNGMIERLRAHRLHHLHRRITAPPERHCLQHLKGGSDWLCAQLLGSLCPRRAHQRDCPRVDRDRHDSGDESRAPSQDDRGNATQAHWPSRGNRPLRALPAQRPVRLHDRTNRGGQRRTGDAALKPRSPCNTLSTNGVSLTSRDSQAPTPCPRSAVAG